MKIQILKFTKISMLAISLLAIAFVSVFINTQTNAEAENIDVVPYTVTQGHPGEMTVLNEIKTGLMPVGHCLYIYGGAWNDEAPDKPLADYDAGIEAKTIGVPAVWDNFYQSQDSSYDSDVDELWYEDHPEVIHWGADCSGYLGWVFQNITNKPHGFNIETYGPNADGWVGYAQEMGYALEHLGYGTRIENPKATPKDATSDPYEEIVSPNANYDYRVGDVYTYGNGDLHEWHCWICLGQCADNSILVLHCSYDGAYIGGTSKDYYADDPYDCDSQALQIARTYMKRYYTDFYNKYGVVGKPGDIDSAGNCTGYHKYSQFKWNNDKTGLMDAEGLRNMTPEKVMSSVFEEQNAQASYNYEGPAASLKFNDALVELNANASDVAYNLNDKEDKTVVNISLSLPEGYKFNSIKVNDTEYMSEALKNSANATITVPRDAAENYSIFTASSDANATYDIAQTSDYTYILAIALLLILLLAPTFYYNFKPGLKL